MEFQYAPGATPLDPDEAAGLVPVHITTQADLNAWEQANIVLGDRWAAVVGIGIAAPLSMHQWVDIMGSHASEGLSRWVD